jgi:hypothetical protein
MQDQMLRGSISRGRGLGKQSSYRMSSSVGGQRLLFPVAVAQTMNYAAVARATAAASVSRCFMAHGAWHLTFDMLTGPFNKALKELLDGALPAQAAATLKAVGLKLLLKITYKTPVDTGLARATWTIAHQRLFAERTPGGMKYVGRTAMQRPAAVSIRGSFKGKGSSQAAAEAGRAIRTSFNLDPKGAMGIEIRNNLEYILPLEYGWSGQAPLGMVRLSVAEMSGAAPAELAALFKASWIEQMYRAGQELRAYSKRFKSGKVREAGVTVTA